MMLCEIHKQRSGNMLMTSPLVKVIECAGRSSIQPTLDDLHDWSVSNHLMLNPAKCHVMQFYFGKKEQPGIDLHIADHHLEVVEKVKLHVVTIQCDLKWDSQLTIS